MTVASSEEPPIDNRRSTLRRVVRRRTGAFAAALAIHTAIFALMFSAAAGDLVSAGGTNGGPPGRVFAVTMVRLGEPSETQTGEVSGLHALVAKSQLTADEAIPIPISDRQKPLASVIANVLAQHPPDGQKVAADAAQQGGSRYPAPRPLGIAPERTSDTHEPTIGGSRDATSTGALWGALEPCWRNLGSRGRVPVVLDVDLALNGRMRVPPKVLRDQAALLDEPRLQAEASALAAVASCLPRADPRFGGRVYRLEFPAAP